MEQQVNGIEKSISLEPKINELLCGLGLFMDCLDVDLAFSFA
jgi:hypothetical protein